MDGLYIVELGILWARYVFAEHTQDMEEAMFVGTLAGELSALSDPPRNMTVLVERPAVLWKLSGENLRGLRELATAFTLLVLKCKALVVFVTFWLTRRCVAAKIDCDIFIGALASRQ